MTAGGAIGSWEKRSWTKRTTIAPSPTAVAQRLIDPERMSPTAKTPGALVSRIASAPARRPVSTKPSSSSATVPLSHSEHGEAPRKRKRKESGDPFAVPERRGLQLAVAARAARRSRCAANGDARPLEVVDQVVGHRLAQVGAAMEQRHERAAAGEPDRSLGGRVAAADDPDAGGAATLRLLRAGRVEDADALVRRRRRRRAAGGSRRPLRGRPRGRSPRDRPPAARGGARRRARARSRGTGVAVRAPNFRAWVIARTVSSEPLMPAGKPR